MLGVSDSVKVLLETELEINKGHLVRPGATVSLEVIYDNNQDREEHDEHTMKTD